MDSGVFRATSSFDPAVGPSRRVGTGLLDYIRKSVCPRVQLEQLLREGAA